MTDSKAGFTAPDISTDTSAETTWMSAQSPQQEGPTMHDFAVSGPVRLRVQMGAGRLEVEAKETDQVTVDVRGGESSRETVDQTVVEHRGDEVVVEVPRRAGFLRRSAEIEVVVTLPPQSRLDIRTESADVVTSGPLGDSQVKTGSGDLRLDHTGELRVQSGSGDVTVGTANGTSTVTTGSGDVVARLVGASGRVSTGSGDIRVERAAGPLQVNSGSGDVSVDTAGDDVTANTASGDQHLGRVERGRVRLNSASGDIHVGVADGTAVWLDVNTISGSLDSALSGGEPPGEDEDSVELRVNTVSGDIALARA